MVFGGYAGTYLDSVEVIDLTNPSGGCEKAPLPHPTRGQYVGMVKDADGRDVVQMCGGYQVTDEDQSIVDTCYQYDPVENEWTELQNK